MPLIAIVEDDEKLRAELVAHLGRYGFRTYVATEFGALDEELANVAPNLILLDVTLPAFDGFYWCRQLRRTLTTPIMFVTARDGDMDQVMALEYGADDFISKPVHPDLLLARIRSLLRRSSGAYAEVPDTELAPGVLWNPRKMQLSAGGRTIDLAKNENILIGLFQQANVAVLSREQLLDALWDDAVFVDDNTLSVNINRLRKRLAEVGLPNIVHTVRGVGYRFGEQQ